MAVREHDVVAREIVWIGRRLGRDLAAGDDGGNDPGRVGDNTRDLGAEDRRAVVWATDDHPRGEDGGAVLHDREARIGYVHKDISLFEPVRQPTQTLHIGGDRGGTVGSRDIERGDRGGADIAFCFQAVARLEAPHGRVYVGNRQGRRIRE